MACVLAGHHRMVKIRDFGKVSWSVGKQTMDGGVCTILNLDGLPGRRVSNEIIQTGKYDQQIKGSQKTQT